MSAEIESHQRFSFFPFKNFSPSTASDWKKNSSLCCRCSGIGKSFKERKAFGKTEYRGTSAKFCLPFSYFLRLQAHLGYPPPWNWKRKTFWKDEISPSFSMLNFHFQTRIEKCIFIFFIHQHQLNAGYQHMQIFGTTIMRCAMQHETSKNERKIAVFSKPNFHLFLARKASKSGKLRDMRRQNSPFGFLSFPPKRQKFTR